MTTEEILAMVPGRKLDVLIAKKVFGWECTCEGSYWGNCKIHDQATSRNKYSTDIAAAWEVVERLKNRYDFLVFKPVKDLYQASFVLKEHGICYGNGYIDDYFDRYEGKTAPEAISRAALMLVMNKK